MKSSPNRGVRYGHEDGQALVLFVLFSIVLIVFVGMAIDLGFAYVTKARLSKAIDAASLAAVSNYSGTNGGAAYAELVAKNTFWANYGSNGVTGLATGQVTPVGTFSTDQNGNLVYTNTVSTTINTYFLRVLGALPGASQWRTLTVGDTAVATRAPVVMTLVLDRTGSMDPTTLKDVGPCSPDTAGGLYLPGAVNEFINIFDETLDRAALVTFSVSAVTDVPMSAKGKPFKNNITTAVNKLPWAGSTCSVAGLTNALLIQSSAGAPANAVTVVVFFTDGRANMTQSVLNGIPLNFGGQDPNQAGCTNNPGNFGADFYLTNAPENNPTSVCNVQCFANMNCRINGKNFTSSQFTDANGNSQYFCPLYITADATNRCVLVADQMRASSNYVYAVGLAADANAFAPPTLVTLQQIANDPDSPTFDPTQPVGAAFLTTGQNLSEVFQQVAADIILRLVH